MTTDDREGREGEEEGGESEGAPNSELSEAVAADRMFGTLSNPTRRFALYYLHDRERATLEELATVLVGWLTAREDQTAVATPTNRRVVRVGLHHVHLPELADCGLVTYDREAGDVELESLSEAAEATLERSFAIERDRSPSDDGEFGHRRAER